MQRYNFLEYKKQNVIKKQNQRYKLQVNGNFMKNKDSKLAKIGIFNKILFILLIFILGSCNFTKQDTVHSEELLDTLYWEESNTISNLVLKACKSIHNDTNAFFETCKTLNDSIKNRTDNYIRLLPVTYINEITSEIKSVFVENNYPFPKGIPDALIFSICIDGEKTVFVQYKQTNIDKVKEEMEKFLFEFGNLDKSLAYRKKHTDLFGEVEIPKASVILSINAKNNKISSNEWLLFFKYLHLFLGIFENKRDNLSIEKFGKNFNSLTFEQKEAIFDIDGCHIVLIFDRECYCK